MKQDLKIFFDSLEDPRRGQGMRHKFNDILTIVFMAIISGRQGLRGFTRFARDNEEDLTRVLNLKHGVPGYSTIRSVLLAIDENVLTNNFIIWAKGIYGDDVDEYIALDGKAIRATTSGGNTVHQNFVALVNAFGHRSGLVYGMESYQNGKSGEVDALIKLAKNLDLQGVTYTGDALQCKKKS